MKLLCIFAAVLVAFAVESQAESFSFDGYSDYVDYIPNPRFRRQVTVDRKVGDDGRVFGTLGSNDKAVFGKAGYEHNIFNDDRGKLAAQVTGTRVLSPYGDSSHVGGALNWQNERAHASLEASKMIHGPTTYTANAGARWPVGRNADITAGGFYSRTPGFGHDYGGRAGFNYRF